MQVANAVGAALSQVSGTEDVVCSLEKQTREKVIQQVKESAKQAAIKAGANPAVTEVRYQYSQHLNPSATLTILINPKITLMFYKMP